MSSSERVYAALKHQILTGMLQPRTRLVELRLAKDLKVSRTPVREALKRLMAEGLVSVDPVRGIAVSHVDLRELEEIYVVREVLDGLAARLAAERVSSSELTKFRLLMDMMRKSVAEGQLEAVVQGNMMFHDLLHQVAGNERLRALSRDLGDFVRRFSTESFSSEERALSMLAEHTQIVEAIENRDGDRAEQIARGHVAAARSFLSSQHLSRSMASDDESPLSPG
jgi:DNA-binding GntR family transcriptional regulator